MSNPFDELHRDADIESSSDGFDVKAYGFMNSIHDPTMGWGGGGLYMETFTYVQYQMTCMQCRTNCRTDRRCGAAVLALQLLRRNGFEATVPCLPPSSQLPPLPPAALRSDTASPA